MRPPASSLIRSARAGDTPISQSKINVTDRIVVSSCAPFCFTHNPARREAEGAKGSAHPHSIQACRSRKPFGCRRRVLLTQASHPDPGVISHSHHITIAPRLPGRRNPLMRPSVKRRAAQHHGRNEPGMCDSRPARVCSPQGHCGHAQQEMAGLAAGHSRSTVRRGAPSPAEYWVGALTVPLRTLPGTRADAKLRRLLAPPAHSHSSLHRRSPGGRRPSRWWRRQPASWW